MDPKDLLFTVALLKTGVFECEVRGKWHDNSKGRVEGLVVRSRPTACVCVCSLIMIIRRTSINDGLV